MKQPAKVPAPTDPKERSAALQRAYAKRQMLKKGTEEAGTFKGKQADQRTPAPFVTCLTPWLDGGETSPLPTGGDTVSTQPFSRNDAVDSTAKPEERLHRWEGDTMKLLLGWLSIIVTGITIMLVQHWLYW